MDRDAAVARIQQDLAFSGAFSTQIVTALQDAQTELEEEAFLPWFLKTTAVVDLTTVAAQQTIALPTSFLGIIQDVEWYYVDASGNFVQNLEKHDRAYLQKTYKDETAAPEAFDIDETNVIVFPLPDAAYTIRIPSYYKAATALSSGSTESDWLKHAHELVNGKAGMKIAQASRDKAAVEIFTAMEARGLRRLIVKDTAYDDVGRRYAMGGPD